MKSIFEITAVFHDSTDNVLHTETVLCSNRKSAEEIAEKLASIYVKRVGGDDEWDIFSSYSESDFERRYDDNHNLLDINLSNKEILVASILTVFVKEKEVSTLIEEKEVFDDVKEYLDYRAKNNVKIIPVEIEDDSE